jgi:RHS repeat-associated protein
VVYDALGRIVETDSGSTHTSIWYTQLGKTAYMNGSTYLYSYWPAPGGATAMHNYPSSGAVYIMHKDWQGNARLGSDLATTVIGDYAYAPYGEKYDVFGSTSQNETMFIGLTQDVKVGMYETPNRELQGSQQGRWLSPDPAGSGWNQYAYATNPNSFIDPSGLQYCPSWFWSYGSGCGNGGGGGFGGNGAAWGPTGGVSSGCGGNGFCNGVSVGADGGVGWTVNTGYTNGWLPEGSVTTTSVVIGVAGGGTLKMNFSAGAAMLARIAGNDVAAMFQFEEGPDEEEEEANPETQWGQALEPLQPGEFVGPLSPPSGAYLPGQAGPLPQSTAANFSWYLEVTLDAPATYYRIWGDPATLSGSGSGTYYSFFDPNDFSPVLDAFRNQISLSPSWNSAANVNAVTFPAGTVVYVGPAAAQQGYSGGGFQVYVLKH